MATDLKVYYLTNVIAPYYVPVLERLRDSLGDLRVFVSTPMEPNRDWKPEWGGLDVSIQKSLSYARHWRHEQGFSDKFWRHIPYDTLPVLLRDRPDVVISLQLGFRTLQAAVYRRLCSKTRLIIWTGMSEHTEKGFSAWRTAQRRLLLSAADAVLVNGASGREYLLRLGVPPEKVFYVPYCAEIAPNLEIPIEREPRVARRLLYIGQLTPRKGLIPFLKLFSEWLRRRPAETYEFWIAGEGPLRGDLQQMPLPPQLQVRFLGSIPYGKLPEAYAQGGVFVFPTLADEWGVVVNEALAAGLPVLGSRYSQAVEEVVEDGVNGWTFRPDHEDEVFSALDRMHQAAPGEVERMRSVGRERIRAFSPAYGAQCYMNAIDFTRPSAAFATGASWPEKSEGQTR